MREKKNKSVPVLRAEEPTTAAERRASMSWAQRLKRVFGIDIETCPACGGAVRFVACIEHPDVIEKNLTHLDVKADESAVTHLHPTRAPPRLVLSIEALADGGWLPCDRSGQGRRLA